MGFKMPHITVIGGLVASGIALLFQVIAVAAAGWIKQTNADITGGLWKYCILNSCKDISSDLEADWLDATRAFALLGLFFIAGALAAGILIMVLDKKFLALIAGAVALVAALFVLISFAVFADNRKVSFSEQMFKLSYCFALSVVTFVLCIGSGASFILSNFLPGSSVASSTG
ncbi:lens fiber membrane intrinsic protein-like [Pomacea canaliculata]|uniref:lens fiber membrane intrinsic protein-like n=1 Tax=Pomacea canaliculata TaxID=400727 RepID=UPI000D737B90|nr:lens fiber membrane intrinsic protein-like [Pomacea canaliculata]